MITDFEPINVQEVEISKYPQVDVLRQWQKIVVWGTGKLSTYLMDWLEEIEKTNLIVCFVDRDIAKQKYYYHGKPVYAPEQLKKLDFDILLLAVTKWQPLYVQATQEFGIPHDKVENLAFYQHHTLLRHYLELPGLNSEQYKVMKYLQTHLMSFAFNFLGMENYENIEITVGFDEKCNLYYALYHGKRMYMARRFNTSEKVKDYVRNLYMEQDPQSPHIYLTSDFNVQDGDVVLDAGVAEGNFSLSVVERVSHIYLIEADLEWIEPLRHTFAPYSNKVTLIHGYLSDRCEGKQTTLDNIFKGKRLDFLKMDIEGAEPAAIYGGRNTLVGKNVRIVVCTYHSPSEHGEICDLLNDYGYKIKERHGYMCLDLNLLDLPGQLRNWLAPRLVNGVICAEPDSKPRVLLFGAGKLGEQVFHAIRIDKCHLCGIIDNDQDKNEKMFCGYKPVSLSNALKLNFDYIVISSMKFAKEMRDACLNVGVTNEKIINYWDCKQKYDFLDLGANLENQNKTLEIRLANAPYEFGIKDVPKIMPAKELLRILIATRKSMARFGDGEFSCALMENRPWFQSVDERLSKRLLDVLHTQDENILIAIADNFGNLDKYKCDAADGIRSYLSSGMRKKVMDLLEPKRVYYDAYVTRPYIIYRSSIDTKEIFDLFQKLFLNRSIIIVEGMDSRFGCNNDLLDGAKSIKRIRCPRKDAYSRYEEIYHAVCTNVQCEDLILLSLGPTATVLAYDLMKQGYQAIDIGQLDNEYDWYKMGVLERSYIDGKGVAEIFNGNKEIKSPDINYLNQVVATVL